LYIWSNKHRGETTIQTYDIFKGDTFLDFIKKINFKFPKCYLLMDKISPHYKTRKVIHYFEENKDTLISVYLHIASPEFMVMEEVWNIAKRDLLILKYYSSFADFKSNISIYFRTKRFGLDMRNYLLRSGL
jgi:DDE superfamily endonuclease